MNKIALTAIALTIGLSGCANTAGQGGMDNKTTGAVLGGALGCAGGALLAKLAGGDMAAGCAMGAVVGGLVGFERARQEEIAEAERVRQEAIQATASLPPQQRARGGEVKTVEVVAKDKATGNTQKVKTFDSVSIDLPISAKGTPEYTSAMGKLKTLAERVADERGSAEIRVAVTPADARASKVSMTGGKVQTAKGNPITVTKVTDTSVPKGMERITVKAGRLRTTEV
ncbi:hypothetical protein [Aquabacterium sp.]|uniref:hypothetical protein n=1 Tax=Aquabacterium sp. TaxID=1872578 RepID=UPI0011DA9083|nr:MAG: hypothetical protein E6Q94_02730 [Burkholderiaceae bacterium]